MIGNPTCSTCKHFAPLSPGYAAICLEKWKGMEWNEAVPLTSADGWCEKHAALPSRSRVLP